MILGQQLDAFTQDVAEPSRVAVPYQRGSASSRDAADRERPRAKTHERDVYNTILAAGINGITYKELADCIGWAEKQQNRITGRVASLVVKRSVMKKMLPGRDGPLRDGTGRILYARHDGGVVWIATTIAPAWMRETT